MLPLRLSPDDAAALASIAERIGSDDDREALTATRAATKMLTALKLDWAAVLEPMPSNDNPPSNDVGRAKFCLQRFGCWSGRELSFLYSARKGRWPLSEKQAAWLGDLYARAKTLPESERADG